MFFRKLPFFTVFVCIIVFNFSTVYAKKNQTNPKKIVVTFSILKDVVSVIGGKRVHVTSLVRRNMDSHMFRPTPRDARVISSADLVVMNGIGFEGWIERLVKASGYKGSIIVASENIKKIDHKEHKEHKEHHHSEWDPHVWLSVPNMKIYIGNIAAGMIRFDPDGKNYYRNNLKKYIFKLNNLDKFIRTTVNSVPKIKRNVITSHDAFGYLSREYGIQMSAPQGVSTESEASALKIASIIRQIKKTSVKAIFLENITDNRLIQQIASQTKVKIGGKLYSDALSDRNGPASNYLDLMRYNIQTIIKALK